MRCRKLIVFLGSIILVVACSTLEPSGLRKMGSLNTGTSYHVFVQGDTAYVANNGGVAIVDISRRDRPRKTATIELKEAAFGVGAHDGLVFIAGPVDGLVIADVQDRSHPRIVGTYPGSGINDVCVDGTTAYASTQQGDLLTIDIGDPSKPALLGSYSRRGGRGLMVECLGDIVYFSTSDKGVDVLDVSDPASSQKLITIPNTQGAIDAHQIGDLLYLACHGNGVRILDVSDPRLPVAIASFINGGEAWGVGGGSQYLWVGDLQEGVEIYDVSDPLSPILLTQDHRYAPHDLFYDGVYAYLADQDHGFVILQFDDER